jgi:DNA-binding transcriptional MerR regulator
MSELSIAEVAHLTKLSAHTLRYYERIGLVSDVGRASGGQRVYVEADVGWIRFIQMLRKTGMPLDQIAQFVELEKLGPNTIAERHRLLQHQRQRLRQHIDELTEALAALDQKVDYYSSANPHNCSCMATATIQVTTQATTAGPTEENNHAL